MNTSNKLNENKESQAKKPWKIKERIENIETKARKGVTAALIGLSLTWGLSSCENRSTDTTKEKIEQVTPKKELSKAELKKKPIDLGYEEMNKEYKPNLIRFPKLSQENLIQWKISPEEKILRCLRRKPITDAVEKKYDIPSWLLMAMMAQEWAGDPTLPNILNRKANPETGNIEISKSDWGLGLIHIQGANAEDFGLKVLQTTPGEKNSKKMQDTLLGAKIIEQYKKTTDLKILYKYDERWHPILAVDCAARFLKSKYNPKDWKDARILALNRYSGRNWTDYATKVLKYRVTIDKYENQGEVKNIPEFTKWVNEVIENEKKSKNYENFNTLLKSIEVEIDKKKGWYKVYLDYNKEQCYNYGLQEYINQTN